jgi:ribosomal-protein-alanine N-acetyltransferase
VLAEVDHITIDRMAEDDVDEVVRIEKTCFSDPWSKTSFREELRHGFSVPLVVKSGKKVVGYTCLWYIDSQMEIANFAVSAKNRRRGIAKRMMERVLWEAQARGCKQLILSVRESNLPAINLYIGFGFVEVHRRRGYYRLPVEDALIMVKNLWEESER